MKVDTNTLREKENPTNSHRSDTGISVELEAEKERTPKFKKLERECTSQIQELGVLVAVFSPLDGVAIHTRSAPLADRLVSVAEVNKEFCATLEKMLNASPVFALIGECSALILAILANHGLNPLENMAKKNGNSILSGMAKTV